MSDDDCDLCGQCLLSVEDGSSRVIKCDACQQLVHQHCTNMSEKVFYIFIKIKADVRWVCEVCMESLQARDRNLQTAMVTSSEEVASVKCELANMKEQMSNNVTDTVVSCLELTLHISLVVLWLQQSQSCCQIRRSCKLFI